MRFRFFLMGWSWWRSDEKGERGKVVDPEDITPLLSAGEPNKPTRALHNYSVQISRRHRGPVVPDVGNSPSAASGKAFFVRLHIGSPPALRGRCFPHMLHHKFLEGCIRPG